MSLEKRIEEEARLIILRTLDEQLNNSLSSSIMRDELETRWLINKTRDWVHVQFAHLAEVGAITVQEVTTVQLATLNQRGRDHIQRRVKLPGVKLPSLES